MKRILIIGSSGMAGHMIKNVLGQTHHFNIYDIARDDQYGKVSYQFDVTDFEKLKITLINLQPHYVINCVGILNMQAEEHPANAILINSYLPHFLAEICTKLNLRLIHISTDCVFSGKKGNYIEKDFKDGKGIYAQSKSLGEVDNRDHLTIRTSIIGPELKTNGIGLFNWFLKQEKEIRGYSNVFWSGVTTLQLAKSILHIIKNKKISGIFHLSNNVKISKYELLLLMKKCFRDKDDIKIIQDNTYRWDKSLLNTNTILGLTSSYEQMLLEQKEWMLDKEIN